MQEERDAKRSTMDGRYEYILSIVADKLGMKQEDAEDFVLEGDQLREIESFLGLNGRPSLLFYYLPPSTGAGKTGEL